MAQNSPYSSLKANATYHGPNHASYHTDSNGRIMNWSAVPGAEAGKRNPYAQRTEEGKNKEQHDAGHLLAANQGGSGEKYNLVPMAETVNRRDYRAWERENESLIRQGYDVQLRGSLTYSQGSTTNNPEAIMVSRDVYKDGAYLYTEHFSITNYDLDALEGVGEKEAFEMASQYDDPATHYYDEKTDTVYNISGGNGKNSFALDREAGPQAQENAGASGKESDAESQSCPPATESDLEEDTGLSL